MSAFRCRILVAHLMIAKSKHVLIAQVYFGGGNLKFMQDRRFEITNDNYRFLAS